jgi:crossover junction endonuclease MUS81
MADDCANPLLLGWVKEWLDQARDRNSKGALVYKKAYDSLKSCPFPFTHPSEAKQLINIGDKLCKRLTDKMKEFCEENGLPMPQIPKKKKKRPASANPKEDEDEEDDENAAPSPANKKRNSKPYVPKLRTGAYGIILALSTLDEKSRTGINKQEVIELAQPHCDASYTAGRDTTSFYTAWKSMDTLNKNDLVYKKGRPEKYYLTDDGWDVAKRMRNTISGNVDTLSPKAKGTSGTTAAAATTSPSKAKKQPSAAAAAAAAAAIARSNDDSFVSLGSSPVRRPAPSSSVSPKKSKIPDIIPDGHPVESASSLPEFMPIALPPGSFTVELVLDVREVRSKKDREGVQNELISNGVNPIMRALELGDILWVAKMKDPNLLSRLGAEGDEVLLDWIVERKRLDDLIGSIKDGRFHEQKFRLRKSGIKNVIYIIEEFSISTENSERYQEAVESAIASTQIVNGYFVKKTQHLTDSVLYLARMTKMLKGIYEDKPLQVIPTKVITTHNYLPLLAHLRETKPAEDFHVTYSAFASLSSKSDSLTLKDVFLKMLMCVKGVTGEKALEIQKRWKTPNEFLGAFEKCGDGEQGRKKKMELVSSQMANLVGKKKIQKALSVKISEVWGDVKVD